MFYTTSGIIYEGKYQPTNEFRRLQKESQRNSNEVGWGERSKLLNDELRKRIVLSLSKELQSRSRVGGDNFRFDIKASNPFGQIFNLSKFRLVKKVMLTIQKSFLLQRITQLC